MSTKLPVLLPFSGRYGNAYLLPHRDGFIAVDVGSQSVARRMVRYVRRLGKEPQSITVAVATHLHGEHTGGMAELQRLTLCSIAVHRQGKKRREPSRRSANWLHKLSVIVRRPWAPAWGLGTSLEERFQPDQWLASGAILPGGWEVIYTPGHTAESICLFHPRHQILLAGDTLISERGGLWVNPLQDDAEVLSMSLCTLSTLTVKIVYPAHGRPVRGQAAFERALNRQGMPGAQVKLQQLVQATVRQV